MGTEDWILKGTKLITKTVKQKLKIQSRGQSLKNTILKIQNKINHKNYFKRAMKCALKIGSFFFFCKVRVGYKNENQRINKELKLKKLKSDNQFSSVQ